MTVTRMIIKYPNRRMYDLSESRYITLADIRTFALARDEFQVTDKTTRRDITNRILLKVITDQEDCDEPVLSREFLLQTIRSYETPDDQGQRVSGADSDSVRSPAARVQSHWP
jgi:polyhydroxyalkanoate synthesis repressor PhaR